MKSRPRNPGQVAGKRSADAASGRRSKPGASGPAVRVAGSISRTPVLLAGVVLALVFSLASVPNNPLGFYFDESSIAYNAYTIARSGSDEYGVRWPLYFRAFGEFKNPTFIYLLAGLFKIFGPSVGLARLLSGMLGLGTCLLLGRLTERMTGKFRIALMVALTALVTPWLFEISRLVFEVALFPLALALFLLALHRMHTRGRWTLLDGFWLAITLGLITYTYSIGRLLGPLLAGGLLFFARRSSWRGILYTWIAYGVVLFPLLVFGWRHPGALSARFSQVSYVGPESTLLGIAGEFIRHSLANLSFRSLLLTGDPNPRHHVPGMGSLLAATVILAGIGVVLVLSRHWRDPWWRLILLGLAAAGVPASLTDAQFHTLRLVAFPVFLQVLTVPALVWLCERGKHQSRRRVALTLLVLATALQAAVFQWQFYRDGPKRRPVFDAGYPEFFASATSLRSRPIYLVSRFHYIHAYWYGALQGMEASAFVRLAPDEPAPAGSLVIGDLYLGDPCPRCEVILLRPPFIVHKAL